MGFGADVDYGQIVKEYASPSKLEQRRYSPASLVAVSKEAINGQPNPEFVCTSFIERSNLTLRTSLQAACSLNALLFKEVGEFQGRDCVKSRVLQFREASPDYPLHSSDGIGN
jgi:hypothetical protein